MFLSSKYGILLTAMLGYMLCNGVRQIIASTLPLIRVELQLNSYVMLGLVAAAYEIGFTSSLFPSGYLADRFNNAILSASGLLVIAFSVGFGAAATPIVFVYALTAAGIGYGIFLASSLTLVTGTFSRSRMGLGIGTYLGTGQGMGKVVYPIVATLVLAYASWRSLYLGVAIVAGLLGFLLAIYAKKVKPVTSPQLNSLRHLLTSETASLGFANFLVINVLTLSSFIPLVLVDRYGVDVATGALALGIFNVAGFFSSPLIGAISDRFGRGNTFVAVATGATLSILALFFSQSITSVMTGLCVAGFLIGSTNPLILALTWDISAESSKGSSMGFVQAWGAFGGAFSSILLGFLMQFFGVVVVFWYCAMNSLAAALVVLAHTLTSKSFRSWVGQTKSVWA